MRDGYPAAVEMGEGRVLLAKKPFIAPNGEPVVLNPAEAGALVLTSVGMAVNDTTERLETWFDADVRLVHSMHEKLCGSYRWRQEPRVVVAAFDTGIYVPDIKPRLSRIRPVLRQRFFDFAVHRASGAGPKAMASALDMKLSTLHLQENTIVSDMGLDVKRYVAALTMLAGAAGGLPSQRQGEPYIVEPHLLEKFPSKPLPNTGPFRAIPEEQTHKIIYNPTEDFLASLRFAGQALEREEPDMHDGYIDEVRLCGAVVEVKNKLFKNDQGEETWLEPAEMAALLLRTMLEHSDVMKLTGSNTGKTLHNKNTGRGPLLRAYDKLLPPRKPDDEIRRYASFLAIRSAFVNGLLVARQRASTYGLEPYTRRRLPAIGNSLAEGRGYEGAASELGLSPKTLMWDMMMVHRQLNLTTAGLVLITEADRWLNRMLPTDAQPDGNTAA